MDEFENIKNKINIRDIKSSFIIKKIFSFLSKKQRLNMIIFNKKLKKMLSIRKRDYNKICQKYKSEKNGKGKEYFLMI